MNSCVTKIKTCTVYVTLSKLCHKFCVVCDILDFKNCNEWWWRWTKKSTSTYIYDHKKCITSSNCNKFDVIKSNNDQASTLKIFLDLFMSEYKYDFEKLIMSLNLDSCSKWYEYDMKYFHTKHFYFSNYYYHQTCYKF